jgi:hypothetical protein
MSVDRQVSMRAFVSVYLAAVAAAGPWLCCCAGDFLAQKPVRAAADQPPPKHLPSCCQHKQKSPMPSGNQPITPPSKCSCQQHRPDAIVTSPDSGQALTLTSFLRGFGAALPSSDLASLPLTETTASRGFLTPPCRSPGDILRTLHILRC